MEADADGHAQNPDPAEAVSAVCDRRIPALAFEPRDYPALPDGLRDQLRLIQPTLRADGHRYWPVQAVLHDGGHTANLLPDGRVLLAGGLAVCAGISLSSAELYQP